MLKMSRLCLQSHLSFLGLLAADIIQAVDLHSQLLILSGHLLDFVRLFLTFLMYLVTLSGVKFNQNTMQINLVHNSEER